MEIVIAFFILLSAFISVVQAQEFNLFKSYKDAKVKPPQYSRVRTQHAVDEYLSVTQKKMKKYRQGPDRPDFMFDKNWSGFNKAQNTNKGETRRRLLRGYGEESKSTAWPKISSFLSFRFSLLAAIGILISLVVYQRTTGSSGTAKRDDEALEVVMSDGQGTDEDEGKFVEA